MHCCARLPMCVHRCACVCQGVHACACVCMDVHGCAWLCMGMHVCTYVRTYVCACVSMAVQSCAWLCMCVRAACRDDAAVCMYAWVDFTPFRLAMSHTSYSKNVIQGKTALHFACATGLADVVVYLTSMRADLTAKDSKGRGVLQLASNAQGDGQNLYRWLKKHNPDLKDTSADGKPQTEKLRGSFSSQFRHRTIPGMYRRRQNN